VNASGSVNIPDEMLTRGRPAIQDFDNDELLFYRLEQYYPVGSHPSGLSLRRPEFSVNREKYGGKPDYVLIPDWLRFGIATFHPHDLPRLLSAEEIPFTWSPVHIPEPANYHHSEVHTFKNGTKVRKSGQISELVWRQFKQLLGEKMVVLKSFEEDDL
jgi:hypothetical protein